MFNLILFLPKGLMLYLLRIVFVIFCWISFLNPTIGANHEIALSGNSIPENEELYTFVGKLTIVDDPDESYSFKLDNQDSNSDNRYFKVSNDSLFTYWSFDYEVLSACNISIVAIDESNNQLQETFEIQIEDVSGKFDANGIADADVAAKYPQVQEGDYIFFNPTSNQEIYQNSGIGAGLSYPNKILIKGGDYSLIYLALKDISGNSTDEPVVITNFLGQIYTNRFRLLGGKNWRLTAEYDPLNGTGSSFYRGCVSSDSDVDYSFSAGNYGIWVSREWASESTGSNFTVSDTASHFEIDHIEISDGGFAGMLIKEDNGSQDMNHVHLHHLYIHDIGSEGIYLGSTQSDPQHMFNNLLIEQCNIVRTGSEALQVGQLGENCVIRNNVLWGAFDWASPFQRYQDNVAQVGTRQGGLLFEKNILIGGGEKFLNISNQGKEGIVPNNQPVVFQNNLFWSCRGICGAYMSAATDGSTGYLWKDNYWGNFDFNYDIVYPDLVDWDIIILVATQSVDVDVTKNCFDYSSQNIASVWGGGTAHLSKVQNIRENVEAPDFINFFGESAHDDYLKWMRWTATIGEDDSFQTDGTNKGDPMIYSVGDIVQYNLNGRTRFYRCLQEHSGKEPGESNAQYWELLTWQNGDKISFYPPDDARLKSNSVYQPLGMGLENSLSTSSNSHMHTLWEDVKIWPTQVENELVVEMQGTAIVEVFSMDGRMIMNEEVSLFPATLSVDFLSPGPYVVRVWNDKIHVCRKIVKR